MSRGWELSEDTAPRRVSSSTFREVTAMVYKLEKEISDFNNALRGLRNSCDLDDARKDSRVAVKLICDEIDSRRAKIDKIMSIIIVDTEGVI